MGEGGNPAAVEMLVSYGANLEARTDEQYYGGEWTPLHTAANCCMSLQRPQECGHLKTVKKLVELGANMNAMTGGWNSACGLASQAFKNDIVDFLNEQYEEH